MSDLFLVHLSEGSGCGLDKSWGGGSLPGQGVEINTKDRPWNWVPYGTWGVEMTKRDEVFLLFIKT